MTELWLVPSNERDGSDLASWIIGLVRTIELPGLLVAETARPRFQHHVGQTQWVILSVSMLPLTMAGAAIVRRWWNGKSRVRSRTRSGTTHVAAPPQETVATTPNLQSRRDLFRIGRRTVMTGAAGVAGYALLGEIRRPAVTRQTFSIRDLPTPLDGLRIVQLSDIHHGPWTSLQYVQEVVAQANALQPDLVLLTGDYVHASPVYIEPVAQALAQLRGHIGVLATLGNHDWWEDGKRTICAFGAAGVPLLDNTRVYLTAERTIETRISQSSEKSSLCIAGVGDLWEDPPSYDAALGGLPAGMPRLLLSHNPDVAEEPAFVRLRPRVDLMLSGHTHGGQVSLPLLGPIVTPSKYGARYASGLVQGPVCPVYINRGIGTTIVPMRMRVRPEITVIELRPA